jgi:hypothetical protein
MHSVAWLPFFFLEYASGMHTRRNWVGDRGDGETDTSLTRLICAGALSDCRWENNFMLDRSHLVSRLTVVIHSRANQELWYSHPMCASSLQGTIYHSL